MSKIPKRTVHSILWIILLFLFLFYARYYLYIIGNFLNPFLLLTYCGIMILIASIVDNFKLKLSKIIIYLIIFVLTPIAIFFIAGVPAALVVVFLENATGGLDWYNPRWSFAGWIVFIIISTFAIRKAIRMFKNREKLHNKIYKSKKSYWVISGIILLMLSLIGISSNNY